MQKTFIPKFSKDEEIKFFMFDAKDKILGRLATEIAKYLTGKNTPEFTHHLVPKTKVIVINAENIAVTGNKMSDKKYYRHSRYPGNLKEKTLEELMDKKPTQALLFAVKGMLPKNKLRKEYLKNLYIFPNEEHDKAAQKPIKIEI